MSDQHLISVETVLLDAAAAHAHLAGDDRMPLKVALVYSYIVDDDGVGATTIWTEDAAPWDVLGMAELLRLNAEQHVYLWQGEDDE